MKIEEINEMTFHKDIEKDRRILLLQKETPRISPSSNFFFIFYMFQIKLIILYNKEKSPIKS